MAGHQGVLLWGARAEGLQASAGSLGEDPGLVQAPLDPRGRVPPHLPACTAVVVLADWDRLADDPTVVERWRQALGPAPVAVIAVTERGGLGETLARLPAQAIDDVVEWPWHPDHLALKIRTTLKHLGAQHGAHGLRTELSEQAADFRDFHRIALSLSAERDANRLLELIVTKCREVTCADAGSLYLVEEQAPAAGSAEDPERVLRFVVAQNDSRTLDLTRITLPLDRTSIAGYVALTRQPLRLDDVYRLPADLVECRFNPAMDGTLGYRTTSMLVIPMVAHTNEVIGVIQLINKKRASEVRLGAPEAIARDVLPFVARDQEMVGSLASLAAVVAVRGRQAEQAQRELEAQFRQSQKMEAVGRLAGGVAHDFNNLLTVVTGRCQLLLNRMPPDDGLRRHAELILQTAERAAGLTRQLLAFSRKQVLQPRVLSLDEVVTNCETILRRLIGEDVRFDMVRQGELGLTKADRVQIEQVVMNLAVNARDAMPHGGRLTIETANVELDEAFIRRHPGSRAGRYVMLAVRDTGTGMDAEVQAHIFEPFFTTKEPGKGTGLGLATVYGIVKQHQGYITVESTPGRGATFRVYLPRADEPLGPAESAAPSRPAGGSETILLVEDEEGVRELAREILVMHGYRVLEARNGREALAVSDGCAEPIHLLLTDVVMPELGGRAVADHLLAARPDIKVLFMSGYTADAIVHHGVLDPGTVLLLKPFTPDGLVRKVRELLLGRSDA